jgi:hypothetical protein
MDVTDVFNLVARATKYTKKKSKIRPGVIAAIIVIVVFVIIIACIVLFFVKRSKKKAALGGGKFEGGPVHNVEGGTPMVAPPGGNTNYQPLQPQPGQQPPQGYGQQGYPQQSYPMGGVPGYNPGYPPGPQATGHTGAESDYYRHQ